MANTGKTQHLHRRDRANAFTRIAEHHLALTADPPMKNEMERNRKKQPLSQCLGEAPEEEEGLRR